MNPSEKKKPLEIRGAPIDEGAEQQIRTCLMDDEAAAGALCADHHLGYSMPIGGVVAYRGAVSPSGVGYDIACGNKAVRTNLRVADVREDIPSLMDEIYRHLEFGMGRTNPDPVPASHELFDDPTWRDVPDVGSLKKLAQDQLGTIGSGNHYVDLFEEDGEEDGGWLWVGVHFGSRGFGHKMCTGFLNLAKGRAFAHRAGFENMHGRAVVFSLKSRIGQDYFAGMKLAGRYAYAGRDYVCRRVLEILGARAEQEVHNHHNYAWEEEHGGQEFIIVRKGATPAWPGQKSFIGGSMGDISVIAEGVDTSAARALLRSTVHGAGRVMSRTAAAGRKQWRGRKMIRKGGRFTRQEMNANMKRKGIVLRGADTDEDPRCYKSLSDVLNQHKDALQILRVLKPLGVAMAGADVRDDFRD